MVFEAARIPSEVIKLHHDVEEHEIAYADGGSTPLSDLKP
jgi:hypothetical protein